MCEALPASSGTCINEIPEKKTPGVLDSSTQKGDHNQTKWICQHKQPATKETQDIGDTYWRTWHDHSALPLTT